MPKSTPIRARNQRGGKAGQLSLDGPLTVRTADHTRSALLEAIQAHSTLHIDCHTATDIDFSFIQLLLSARKTAESQGKQLCLAHPANGILHERLLQGGFIGSSASAQTQAFWQLKE